MIDMANTIIPKSDQTNSDDLTAGPRTIKITHVSANPESAEQPVSVSYEGDNGKPYKPCKSMRRVMVEAWGRDASQYVGRSMTIYKDPTVRFGGLEVGGIRISHMSHIDKDMTMALTATRAQRKPYTVRVLQAERAPEIDPIDAYAKEVGRMLKEDRETLRKWWHEDSKEYRLSLDIPQARLEKMGQAVAKALTVTGEGE